MAYFINNIALSDRYSDAGTLGPFMETDTVTVLVSGNPANMQFYVGDQATGRWTDEREYTAPAGSGTTNSFKVSNVRGIRIRNANAGSVAVVSVTLFRTGVVYDSWDPIFEAGSLSPGTINASGGVSPGGASMEVDHNGVPISTEPKMDFEDAGANIWSIVDDAPNARTKVTPPKIITGGVNTTGVPAYGTGYTCVKNSTGNYTITFTSNFAVLPIVIVTPLGGANITTVVSGVGAGSFTLQIATASTGAAIDNAFNFLAFATG